MEWIKKNLIYIPLWIFIIAIFIYTFFIQIWRCYDSSERLCWLNGTIISWWPFYLGLSILNLVSLYISSKKAKNTQFFEIKYGNIYTAILVLASIIPIFLIRQLLEAPEWRWLFIWRIYSWIALISLIWPLLILSYKSWLKINKKQIIYSSYLLLIIVCAVVSANKYLEYQSISNRIQREQSNIKRLEETKINKKNWWFTITKLNTIIIEDTWMMTNIVANISPTSSLYQKQRSGQNILIDDFCKASFSNEICTNEAITTNISGKLDDDRYHQ